ncbi:MAG: AraC family transcriptional regulator N-terminal domain-containing protein, partial [Waterburya sp.]
MTVKTPNPDVIAARCQELATLVMRHTKSNGNGIHPTAIKQLDFTRSDVVSTSLHDLFEPFLAIVVQGQKEVWLDKKRYQYGVAQYLIVSVDLPASGCMLEATPDKPYLGLKLNLDLMQLCDLVTQMTPSLVKKEKSVQGLSVSNANTELFECVLRLVKLLDTPQHISMLAPLIIRELYYHLLIGEQGKAVRQIATSGSNMQRIASAIKLLKAEFTQPMRIDDLARRVSMSTSSFHQHFKQV